MTPRLERWILHHDTLVGYIFDDKKFQLGERVQTEIIREFDPLNFEAVCLDGKYKLGEPGTVEEHNRPLISRTK